MMARPARPVAFVLAVALLVAACDGDDRPGTSRTIGDEPLGDDEVVLHLVRPPELPAALAGATVTEGELRTEDRTDRQIVQVVDAPARGAALQGPLVAGAIVRVVDGATVEVAAAVDVAHTDGGDPATVTAVDGGCADPCVVEGPALIAPDGWFVGFGVAVGYLVLVPAPTGDATGTDER